MWGKMATSRVRPVYVLGGFLIVLVDVPGLCLIVWTWVTITGQFGMICVPPTVGSSELARLSEGRSGSSSRLRSCFPQRGIWILGRQKVSSFFLWRNKICLRVWWLVFSLCISMCSFMTVFTTNSSVPSVTSLVLNKSSMVFLLALTYVVLFLDILRWLLFVCFTVF